MGLGIRLAGIFSIFEGKQCAGASSSHLEKWMKRSECDDFRRQNCALQISDPLNRDVGEEVWLRWLKRGKKRRC